MIKTMENIEERCEENLTDGERTPLLAVPTSLTSSLSAPSLLKQSEAGLATSTDQKGMALTPEPIQALPSSPSSSSRIGIAADSSLPSTVGSSPPSLSSYSPSFTSSSSVMKRMPHLHKLEKKHSSGDLHSRLKTRKLLGVGETDDGDIHRSKLSQILGHSDQLYVKLPAGLRVWQVFVALMFTVIGLWALILPSHIFHTTLETPGVELITLPIRLYGGALLSLSIVYWMTLSSQDRDIIRMSLLTCVVYFIIQLVVSAFSPHPVSSIVYSLLGPYVNAAWRAVQLLGCLYYYFILTRDGRHYR